ncbi:hypothetical protein HFD88_005561 [Aspergillus terreus]|nr:hypothetical protein HFD88_005561 [Aspergillus terreus]
MLSAWVSQRDRSLREGPQRFVAVQEEKKISEYYTNAFLTFTLEECRHLADHVIDNFDPEKSETTPYSGGESGDPETTKPLWWPAGVSHRPPQFLGQEIFTLLVRLFQVCPYDKIATAASDARLRSYTPAKFDLRNEILEVRRKRELFERKEIILPKDIAELERPPGFATAELAIPGPPLTQHHATDIKLIRFLCSGHAWRFIQRHETWRRCSKPIISGSIEVEPIS